MNSKGRIRSAVTTDRLIVLGVAISLGVAACAAIDEAQESEPSLPITIATSTTTSTTTTSTSTTTTVVPTTTIAPTAEVISAICASLRSDGFETRRVMVDALSSAFTEAGGEGDGRAEVTAECGDALGRLDSALEIRDRLQTIDMAEEDGLHAMSLTDFSCAAGTFEVTVTNDAAVPLGLHANLAMYLDGDREDSAQSSFAPIVLWSIEPGASETINGRFVDVPESRIYCELEAQVFDADRSSAGASIGTEPEYPALTGDDPSVWFPALSDVEHAARTSGEIDLVAVTEDVRSMAYDEAALAISDGEALPDVESLEVCERGRSQPDDDRIGFVYLQRLTNGDARLSHGLFRRGVDGQWRWLSTARYYESIVSDDCVGVDPAI